MRFVLMLGLMLSLTGHAKTKSHKIALSDLLSASELETAQKAYHAELNRVFRKHCDRKFGTQRCGDLLKNELDAKPWHANLPFRAYVASGDSAVYGYSNRLVRESQEDKAEGLRHTKGCRSGLSVRMTNKTVDKLRPFVRCYQYKIKIKSEK